MRVTWYSLFVLGWVALMVLITARASPSVAAPGSPLAATAIGTNADTSCAVRADGHVMCWGRGTALGRSDYGYVSGSTWQQSNVPIEVRGITDAVDVVGAGGEAFCALRSTGAVACWGNGSPINSLTPVAVSGISNATQISAGKDNAVGEASSCARLPNGEAWCWGGNQWGQLG